MQLNTALICGKWCLWKVHSTNSSRVAAKREVVLLRFPMTDVQPTEEDKETETETEANQRGWHSARLEVQQIYIFLVWPKFSGTSYLLSLFSSQRKTKMRRRKRRRMRKRLRSLQRNRWNWAISKEKSLKYTSRFSNTSSPSWRWWPCGTPSRLTSLRTGSTRSN